MKTFLLIFLVSFSLPLLCAPKKAIPEVEKKTNWMNDYKSFLDQNSKLRINQELKLYKKQRKYLVTYYKKKMEHLKELALIQNKLEWGNKKKNKSIMALIQKKKEEFKKTSQKERAEFFQKDLKADINSFNRKMKQRRGLFEKKATN